VRVVTEKRQGLLGGLKAAIKWRWLAHGAATRIDSLPDLHASWRQPEPEGNEPSGYIEPVGRSRALASLIAAVPRDAKILEVECNVGRNLAYLYDLGYTNVAGVEISAHAVGLLRQTYPRLANVPVHVGPTEEVLPGFEDGAFDLVFTMAVLEHIHLRSTSVFVNIARIGKALLTIEPNDHSSHRQYPHDFSTIFTNLGFTLATRTSMQDLTDTADEAELHDYYACRFERG
jgi:SAM-dependent methyltransferase